MALQQLTDSLSIKIFQTASAAISQFDYPPYVYMYPPRTAFHNLNFPPDTYSLWSNVDVKTNDLGLYVHIPFCKSKCSFCNLFSIPLPSLPTALKYTRVLCTEIEKMARACRSYSLSTVYIGGGTPSLLPLSYIEDICSTIRNFFQLSKDIEFAIEANPQDVNLEWAKGIRALGFERVNLGTQTFNDSELNSINRPYYLNTNQSAVRSLKIAGLKNISIDLIYGLPDQSEDKWEESVKKALSETPDTISIYSLSRRPNTQYGELSLEKFVNFKERYTLYEISRSLILGDGYKQVTNVRFTTLKCNSYRQQEDHWFSVPILGVGCGAQTYGSHWDYIICSDFDNWKNAVLNYIETKADPYANIFRGYHLEYAERIRKYAILSLHDLSFAKFNDLFGLSALEILGPWFNAFCELELGEIQKERFKLNKQGFKYRDILCRTIFSEKAIVLENAPEQLLFNTKIDYADLTKVSDNYLALAIPNPTVEYVNNFHQ